MIFESAKYEGRGGSIFDGKLDNFDSLDEAWSQWMDALRAGRAKTYLQGEGEKRKEWKIYTVIMNKRGSPCPLCIPFVGKIMIDDVWSGGPKDGISPITGVKYPLMSAAIAAGLYHPRCRDSHTTYFEGISTPPDGRYTREELNNLAEKNHKQEWQQYAERQAKR